MRCSLPVKVAGPGANNQVSGYGLVLLIVDSGGTPKNIQVAGPLGMGLDEKTVAAISSWRFDPALKDGKPVAVPITAEVSFRLY